MIFVNFERLSFAHSTHKTRFYQQVTQKTTTSDVHRHESVMISMGGDFFSRPCRTCTMQPMTGRDNTKPPDNDDDRHRMSHSISIEMNGPIPVVTLEEPCELVDSYLVTCCLAVNAPFSNKNEAIPSNVRALSQSFGTVKQQQRQRTWTNT